MEWSKTHNNPFSQEKSFEAIIHTYRAINEARRQKANIIHVHAIGNALLVPYAKLLGMKVVFTHHGPDYDRDKWGRIAKIILKLGERIGCMFADDVIVISDVIRRLIAHKYNRTKRCISYTMVYLNLIFATTRNTFKNLVSKKENIFLACVDSYQKKSTPSRRSL